MEKLNVYSEEKEGNLHKNGKVFNLLVIELWNECVFFQFDLQGRMGEEAGKEYRVTI